MDVEVFMIECLSGRRMTFLEAGKNWCVLVPVFSLFCFINAFYVPSAFTRKSSSLRLKQKVVTLGSTITLMCRGSSLALSEP